METELIMFDGVELIAPKGLEFPHPTFEGFPKYCGAGEGIGNVLVPESIFSKDVRISPACYIHDVMWARAKPTWRDFHWSNSVFLSNILRIIQVRSKSWFMQHIRNYRAVTYYNAVDTVGALVFAAMKETNIEALS